MLRWMLRVDSWLDVASLENMEEDHSFLFLKKNLIKIFFFFFGNLENLNFSKELKILDFFFFEKFWKPWIFQGIENFDGFFFFFESNLRSTSPMPLVQRPFLKISFFFFFFFLVRYEDLFIIKRWRRWRWRFIHDDFFSFLFFFEKPILWMRITLVGSWCRLLDKSLLNSCKKIISISNGFIHWNELEVLTQCP